MNRMPPTLDMRPDGSFRTPPRVGAPLSFKVMVGAAVIATVTGAIAVAALALWVFAMLLPVVLAAAVITWATVKFRRWQAERGDGERRITRFR